MQNVKFVAKVQFLKNQTTFTLNFQKMSTNLMLGLKAKRMFGEIMYTWKQRSGLKKG